MLEMEQQSPASMSLPKQEKLEIDTLIPDISLLLRLDTVERGSQSVTAQIKKTVEELSKEHTEKALTEYLRDNGEFAEKRHIQMPIIINFLSTIGFWANTTKKEMLLCRFMIRKILFIDKKNLKTV